MMRKYQKGGTKWYYPKEEITDETPYYNPSSETLYINPNYTDDQVAIRQHELFHHLQNINGGLQLPQYYNGPLKKPNIIINGEIQGAYYNRRGIDEENMYNKMIKKSPELQFVPRDILYNGIQGSKGYIPGTDALMYEDPTTAEGEARDYENYIRKGGKTMFPNQTINEYKSGGKWIQNAVKNPGRCTPGSPNYDCPEGSPQWRLAQTFKKHHGFHKKEDLKKYQGGGNTFDTDPLYSVPLNNTFYKEDTVNRINNETLDNYESKLKHYNKNKKEKERITNNLPFISHNKTFYPNPNLPGINPAINFINTSFRHNSIIPTFKKNNNPFLSNFKGDIFHVYDKKNTLGNQEITNYVSPVIDKPIYPKLINFNNTPSTLPLDGNELTVVPQKGSRPYYGPGNTIVGYSDENMQFYPAQQYTGASNNPINLQDKELLENPEVLKKYVQSRDSYKFAEGGPFISNSKKINLNLPVYGKPEMKPLQFNKFFVNDKNQNLYIGGVNPRYQNKDFSVGPYMVGVGNTNFQKLPADIGMSGTYHVNDKFDINTNIGQNNIGAGIKYKFAKGGIPNNPGFNALPKYVQQRIINNSSRNNYQQGGSVTLNAGGENHKIYVKTTNRGEGAKGHIMVNHPTIDKGMWDTIDLTEKAGVKTIAQGVASTKKWHKENPYDMKNKKYQQGGIPYNNLDDVLKKLFG